MRGQLQALRKKGGIVLAVEACDFSTRVESIAEKSSEIRRLTIQMIHSYGAGHYGGCLSIVDILATLYFGIMHVDPKNPRWAQRDRLVLSKGHACAALATTLALKGFFPKEELLTFNRTGGLIGTHPDMHKIPGVDMSTGSLGHGLPVAVGMALASKLSGLGYHVYVITGDGELDEGTIWEGFMASSNHRLDNLTVIVDRNLRSMDGPTEEVMVLEPLLDKIAAFGCAVRVLDGHDINSLYYTLKSTPFELGKPSVVIARTVKGKGIPFIENTPRCHHFSLTEDEYREVMLAFGGLGEK